ncbi:hypothetical protein G647_06052 [Cladophialophora carrionii CBS 160.54]|uniref:Uncharacterized protein n=1 Tax=Cladophialophora carrionii CBS 160.54 TaxID=1279043 RepID=V9D7N6_9EURO|nr:uncharacterized protein G647_06052 [Cladophialophora carrionii CBS 160.54]ETI21982.1 hypothetical protein G647_06052 [Cladophialophora carrionii CBS 160.54]
MDLERRHCSRRSVPVHSVLSGEQWHGRLLRWHPRHRISRRRWVRLPA